ncbi:hypothetical protein, partial [Xanthomonas theicola]|uniref:hypothetical protein n=1 Tax=Xanthomonas theicola TaxID=56464 RepID=UPI001B80A215
MARSTCAIGTCNRYLQLADALQEPVAHHERSDVQAVALPVPHLLQVVPTPHQRLELLEHGRIGLPGPQLLRGRMPSLAIGLA